MIRETGRLYTNLQAIEMPDFESLPEHDNELNEIDFFHFVPLIRGPGKGP